MCNLMFDDQYTQHVNILHFSSICTIFSATTFLFSTGKTLITIYSLNNVLISFIFFKQRTWICNTSQELLDQIGDVRKTLQDHIVKNHKYLSQTQSFKCEVLCRRLRNLTVDAEKSFSINRETLLSIGTNILTYLFILVQLKQSKF